MRVILWFFLAISAARKDFLIHNLREKMAEEIKTPFSDLYDFEVISLRSAFFQLGPYAEPIQFCMRLLETGNFEYLIGCNPQKRDDIRYYDINDKLGETYPECRYFTKLDGTFHDYGFSMMEFVYEENRIYTNYFNSAADGYYRCIYGDSGYDRTSWKSTKWMLIYSEAKTDD